MSFIMIGEIKHITVHDVTSIPWPVDLL